MGTRFGVDAAIGKAEALDRAARHEVLFDDLGCVFRAHKAIPDCLGIDHYGGPVLALIQTKGLVDTNAIGQPSSLGELLQLGMQFAFPIGGARGPGRAGGPNVVADENMMLKGRQ